MSRTNLAARVLAGNLLSEAERAKLSPSLLALLAVSGHLTLSHADRRRLSKRSLALLALSGVIELTRQERDRLSAHELALLAMGEPGVMGESELARLPRALRAIVGQTPDEVRGGGATYRAGRFPRLARVAGGRRAAVSKSPKAI